jgi:putative hydroxymethylpyrimidine transporter CytX
MSFGAALELSIAMPLSWLPLISDYTREAEKPIAATAWSVIVYGLASCWMYLIGLGAALLTGTSDVAEMLLRAGLGIAGLLIVVLATVTTTFLDAYSAGVSSEIFSKKINGKWVAVATAILGIVAAIVFPMDDFSEFLYLIGSIFAPMATIMIVDHFILKVRHDDRAFCWENLVIWLAGFLIYRWLLNFDLAIGSTLIDIIATGALCLIVAPIRSKVMGAKPAKAEEFDAGTQTVD